MLSISRCTATTAAFAALSFAAVTFTSPDAHADPPQSTRAPLSSAQYPVQPEIDTPPQSPELLVAGLVMMPLGQVALSAGSFLFLLTGFREADCAVGVPCDAQNYGVEGLLMMGTGGAFIIAGVIMTAIGGRPSERDVLSLSPDGLAVRF